MKRIIYLTIGGLFLAVLLVGQEKPKDAPKPPEPPPVLSTSDVTAIKALEKTKEEANQQWNDAHQTEMSIVREWSSSHPGWHLHFEPQGSPKNFTPEADVKPEAPKAAEKPAAK